MKTLKSDRLSTCSLAVLLIVSLFTSLVSPAIAASTGITVNDSTLSTFVNTQVNFVASAILDSATSTPGTFVSVNDGGNGGSFFSGTTQGKCNSNTVVTDGQFSIDKNKGVCYSNPTAGVYTLTVQLLDAQGGSPIGAPTSVEVTVNELPNLAYNEDGKVTICKFTNGQGGEYELITPDISSTGELQGGHTNNEGTAPQNIIPPYQWLDENNEVQTYAGRNWTTENIAIYNNDCVELTVSTGTSTAQLKLLKEVIGGTATSGYWFLSATAEGNTYNFSSSGDSAFAEAHTVEAGVAYTLGENSPVSGYVLTDITCDGGVVVGNTVTLAADENVVCTLENTFQEEIDPAMQTIVACKYDNLENPIEGWGMNISNGQSGEEEVTFTELVTDDEGCVSVNVYPEDGPFYVSEEERKGWELVDIYLDGNGNFGEDEASCVFFDSSEIEATTATEFSVSAVNEASQVNFCAFVNEKTEVEEPCVDTEYSGAESVATSTQGAKANETAITDVNRIDPAAALGDSDWSEGSSTGFYSLGFGGSIVLEFNNYVNEVSGTDLVIHEATNGSYPAETALIEVSQDGTTWHSIGSANNSALDRTTELDFSSTGLAWIKFVRVTDTSDSELHDADADGFDLDAVIATKTTCKQPKPTEPIGACEIEGHKYDEKGNPLADWTIGLMKFITQGEVVDTWDLASDVTDEDGYFCLEWDGETRTFRGDGEPAITGGEYSFVYRVYEIMKSGWKYLSVEHGNDVEDLTVATEDDVLVDGNYVSIQIGQENGYIYADDEYHVDFYNQLITPDPEVCVASEDVTCEEEEGGGSSSGGSGRRSNSVPTVSGLSTSTPQGLVLGDQVSVVPQGAAGAGFGWTSPSAEDNSMTLMLVLGMLVLTGLWSARRITAVK